MVYTDAVKVGGGDVTAQFDLVSDENVLCYRPFLIDSFLLKKNWHEKYNPKAHPVNILSIAKHLRYNIFPTHTPGTMISHFYKNT